MRRSARLPIRLRLAATYAALFLAAGTVLLAVSYGLVARNIQSAVTVPPLPVDTSTTAQDKPGADPNPPDRIADQCKQMIVGGKLPDVTLAQCEQAYTAGAQAGAVDQRGRTLHTLLLASIAGLGAATCLSGGLGWIMAGRALRPVTTITEAARRASDRHLGERIALTGPRDELRQLADAFDAMLDRLDRSFTGQRRFVANASHELRTPLTVMRTAIDVTLAKPARTPQHLETMAAEIRDAVERAEATVAALLALARSDQEVTATERADLATCVEDALDSVAARIRAAGLTVEAHLDPAPTAGDAVLVERMAGNIVDNAVAHNVAGGLVRLRTGRVPSNAGPGITAPPGPRVFFEAENTGAALAEDAVPGLFEPFRRMAERTGSDHGIGIGLSIVAAVVAAHRGTVTAHARPGGGLVIRVELPAMADDVSHA